jgi:hypothetical protein
MTLDTHTYIQTNIWNPKIYKNNDTCLLHATETPLIL